VSPARRVRIVAIVSASVAVVLVALIVLLATRSPSTAVAFESPLLSHPAPATKSLTLDGKPLDLSSYKGRAVVLNFFASWCQPCQTEAPQLSAFTYDQAKLANGAAMVGVVFNDSNAAAAKFAASNGVNYPILVDPGGRVANGWGVASPPTTFIISPSGEVVAALVGASTAIELDRAVAPYTSSTASSNG